MKINPISNQTFTNKIEYSTLIRDPQAINKLYEELEFNYRVPISRGRNVSVLKSPKNESVLVITDEDYSDYYYGHSACKRAGYKSANLDDKFYAAYAKDAIKIQLTEDDKTR